MYRRLFLYICAFIFANISTQQTLAVSTHFIEKPIATRSDLLLQKTAVNETYYTGANSSTASVSTTATHYADALGNWQPIDPAFRAIEDGYLVEHNSIQTHVHRDDAQIAAIANDTVINWQATAIGFETANAHFVPISRRKVATELPQRRDLNQQLLFGDHWRNPIVSELIVSEAGSIEQSLRLEKRPSTINDPYYLVMQGELQLLPGSTLWSNGQLQQETFHTDGAVTIYSPENQPTFIFDPILAYEEQHKEIQINGSYHFTPTADPNRWLVAVKTPWSWWEDEQRTYPVILDPRIRVLTGGSSEQSLSMHSNAIGWTNDTMRLGPFFHHTEATAGFVQFNVLPAIPTNNAPLHITKASLRITPTGYWAPGHYLGINYLGEWHPVTDAQSFLFFDGYQINTDVAYMGTCSPAQCPNVPPTPAMTIPLKIAKGQQEANPAPDVSHHALYRRIDPVVTEIDVTDQINGWYNNLITQDITAGPTFRLQQAESCDSAPPYWGQHEKEAYHCTAVDIQPGGVELVIDFAPITLNNGETIYNQQGVPSYAPGAFDTETKVVCTAWDASGETCYHYDYETTAHHYPVSHNIAQWQVVAARGNHDQFPAVDPSNVGLQLWPSPPEEEQLNPTPLAESSAKEGEAAFVLIDGHNADAPTGVLRTAVSAIQPNHSAENINSNYAVQNLRATQWNSISVGTPFNTYAELPSNTLAALAEFNAYNDENLMLSVQIPPDSPLKVYLFEPTSAFAVANRQNGILLKGDNGNLYRNEPVNISGRHALLIVNDGPPLPNPELDPEWLNHYIDIELLRCPQNTIPQQKHTPDCQPIELPDSMTNVSNQVRYVRYATSPDRYLAISSEGGYTSVFRTGGYEWCSTLESAGAPVVAPISPYGENPFAALVNPNQRWAVVGQGRICLLEGGVALDEANGIWAGDLVTTGDSGLALTVNDPDSTANNRSGILRNRLFGQFVYPAIATADGETTLNTLGHFIAKDGNTLINITPYQEWEAEYSAAPILDTGTMQLKATEIINSLVLGDFNQSLMATVWTSQWTITPLAAPTPNDGDKYEFDPNIDQNPPLPGQIPFSGWDLHIAPEQGNLIQEALWHRSGPVVHYFSAQDGRIAADSDLGSAMAINRVVIAPPGQNRADSFCEKNSIEVSCLDLRPNNPNIWSWSTKEGAPPKLPDWQLPDLHITGQTGALMVSTPGQFNAFSADHPSANNNINLPFSFDTWGGEVSISEGPVAQVGLSRPSCKARPLLPCP